MWLPTSLCPSLHPTYSISLPLILSLSLPPSLLPSHRVVKADPIPLVQLLTDITEITILTVLEYIHGLILQLILEIGWTGRDTVRGCSDRLVSTYCSVRWSIITFCIHLELVFDFNLDSSLFRIVFYIFFFYLFFSYTLVFLLLSSICIYHVNYLAGLEYIGGWSDSMRWVIEALISVKYL